MRAELAAVVHGVQEEHPRHLLAGSLHDESVAGEELARLHPGVVIRRGQPVDQHVERFIELVQRIFEGIESHLISVMDDSVVEQLRDVQVVADEMPDQFPGGAGDGIRPKIEAVLPNRSDNPGEQIPLLQQQVV